MVDFVEALEQAGVFNYYIHYNYYIYGFFIYTRVFGFPIGRK